MKRGLNFHVLFVRKPLNLCCAVALRERIACEKFDVESYIRVKQFDDRQ